MNSWILRINCMKMGNFFKEDIPLRDDRLIHLVNNIFEFNL
jgi:hypothetical protein